MKIVFAWSGMEYLADVSTFSATFVFIVRSFLLVSWIASLWPSYSPTWTKSSLSLSCMPGIYDQWTQFEYFFTLFHRLVITNKYKLKIKEESNVRAVKYKKNKTDNLATLVPPQRKSFIMKHLSVSALKLKLWTLFNTFYRISWLSSTSSCKAFVKLAKPFRNALLHLFHKSVIEIIDFGQKIPFQILCRWFWIEKFSCHFILLICQRSWGSCLLNSTIHVQMARELFTFFLH